jgi:hypothetical protein
VGVGTVAVGVKAGDAVTVAVGLGCGVAVRVALGTAVRVGISLGVAVNVAVDVGVSVGVPVGVMLDVGTTTITAPSTMLSWLTGAAPPHGGTSAAGTQVWSVASPSPTDANVVDRGRSLSDHGVNTCSGMVPLASGRIFRSMVSSRLLGSGGISMAFDPGAGVGGGP